MGPNHGLGIVLSRGLNSSLNIGLSGELHHLLDLGRHGGLLCTVGGLLCTVRLCGLSFRGLLALSLAWRA